MNGFSCTPAPTPSSYRAPSSALRTPHSAAMLPHSGRKRKRKGPSFSTA